MSANSSHFLFLIGSLEMFKSEFQKASQIFISITSFVQWIPNKRSQIDFKDLKAYFENGEFEIQTNFSDHKDEIFLFRFHKNGLLRIRLFFQESLGNVVGEIRIRTGKEKDYELCAFLQGQVGTSKKKMIETNLKDEFILIAWKEMNSKLSEEESKKNQDRFLKCGSTEKEVLFENQELTEKNEWTLFFETIGFTGDYPEEYSQRMLEEELKVEHLKYLTDKDLEDLFPIKGHRIRVQIEIKKI
jgi:hypothetical protein